MSHHRAVSDDTWSVLPLFLVALLYCWLLLFVVVCLLLLVVVCLLLLHSSADVVYVLLLLARSKCESPVVPAFLQKSSMVGIWMQNQWRKPDAAVKPGIVARLIFHLVEKLECVNAELAFREIMDQVFSLVLKRYFTLRVHWLGLEGRQGIFRSFAGRRIILQQILSFMMPISFTTFSAGCPSWQDWRDFLVGRFVGHQEWACTLPGERQGCTKNATVLVFVLSSPLVKYQWLRGRSKIYGQNISMLNPHTFTAGLTCFVEDRCSLFIRRHSHCWGGTSEREQSWGRNLSKRETTKKSKKEIKNGKPPKQERFPFLLWKFPCFQLR